VSSSLTVPQRSDLAVWEDTKELRATVKAAVFPDSTDAEMALYLHDCRRNNVHPMDRMIHPQVRNTRNGRRYVAVTSIDLFRSRAGDTGEHAGTSDAVFEVDDKTHMPIAATVTVWRVVKGLKSEFTATARWAEYCPGPPNDSMWKKMPHTMLAKCAEALALRKAFPRELAGNYTADEMDQAERERRPARAVKAEIVPPSGAEVVVDGGGETPVVPTTPVPEDRLGRLLAAIAKHYSLTAPGAHINAYNRWVKIHSRHVGQIVALYYGEKGQSAPARWADVDALDYGHIAEWLEKKSTVLAGDERPTHSPTLSGSMDAAPAEASLPGGPLTENADAFNARNEGPPEDDLVESDTFESPAEKLAARGVEGMVTVLLQMRTATKGVRDFVRRSPKGNYELVDGPLLDDCKLQNGDGVAVSQWLHKLHAGYVWDGQKFIVKDAMWDKLCWAVVEEAAKLHVMV